MSKHKQPTARSLKEGHDFVKEMTQARVALGRSGGSLPTQEVLSFSLAHARARDAVHESLDRSLVHDDLKSMELPIIDVRSQAESMSVFLRRPDLGRRVHPEDSQRLSQEHAGPHDLAIVISSGLSALAVHRHVGPLLNDLIPELKAADWILAPIFVVNHGRVAIQDEIGELTRSELALILLGERPGLGTPDSLGAYLVHSPKRGNTDAKRNCVSNIRPEGLPPAEAAKTLMFLLTQAKHRKLSGVELKDTRELPASARQLDSSPPQLGSH